MSGCIGGSPEERPFAPLDNYLSQHNFRWQITPAAADDIEGETPDGWDSPSATDLVVSGFNNSDSPGYLFYDFGDATAGKGWAASDIYYVAWGARYDVPLPEIYHPSPDQALSWISVEQSAGVMTMQGVMTECADAYNFSLSLSGCSNPFGQYAPSGSSGAWHDMWTTQITYGFKQVSMSYATNIKHQGTP